MNKFRCLGGISLAVGVLMGGPARADLYAAEQAYNSKDFDRAFARYRELAEMGHPLAQETLAVMYVNAEGVKRDNVLGYGWAVIAKENGRSDAAQNIISQLEPLLTDGTRKRVAELQAQFGKSALKETLLPKAAELATSQPYKPDPDKCSMSQPANPDEFYPPAARRQGVSGAVELEFTVMPDGRAHHPRVVIGLPPEKFDEAAKRLVFNSEFRPKKVNGVAVPCTMRAKIRFTIPGGASGSQSPELKKSVADARKGALADDPTSQLTFALLLEVLGNSIVKPPESFYGWYIRAAQAGLPTAQFMVGALMLNEDSPYFDERKALIWLNKAADANQTDAQVDLANYLLRKSSDAASHARAFELLERAAKTDSLEAKYRLASLLASDADESRRDPRRALELLESVRNSDEADPTAFEIRAAANAALGDFKAATSDQERAIRLAAKYGWDLAPQKARLEQYEKATAWTGDLLAL